ncbi:MAG: response regulator [Nitrospirae bacterium]|nr:MAG: response regulator [Nitrospirota bacterium]
MERILLIDDESNVLEAYQRQLRKDMAHLFTLYTAKSGAEALEILTVHGPFAVVVSDYRMPGMDGIEVLARIRDVSPDTVRMMLTGHADFDTAIHAVNKGEIFRFLTKPCAPDILRGALEAGIQQYRLIRAEKELLEGTLTGCLEALADVLALVNPEAFGKASRLKRYVSGLAQHMGLSDLWLLESAAALSQIGCVILPDSLLTKLNAGEPLTPNELQAYAQHPCTGADILSNIPRMEKIAEIIKYQHKHFDGTGTPCDSKKGEEIPLGSRLLKVALDFDTLRMQDLPRSEAYERLQARKGWYDPAVLEALKAAFVPEQKFKLETLRLSELQPHMVLADGIFDDKGHLLVAKGQVLTEWIVTRLKHMSSDRHIKEPIRVIVPVFQPEGASVPETSALTQ